MAKVSVEKFLELFRRTGLVEEAQLAETLREISAQGEGQLPTATEELADRFVAAGLLTRWQADNLLQGKHKGFFLGKYKLLGHLGRGGMSNVYLAEHVMMKRRVAIKILPQNKVEDSSYLARFKLEAQAAASLDHPNIVRAYDTDHKDKTYYIVMEYVQGDDLQAMVQKQGPLDFETAADFIAQVARGLEHAHQAGLIHRDIKPANCLVDQNNIVKLLDMGLAKFSGDDRPSLTIANDENVLGTADYLAPEQALNSHSVDLRADIYSLGCTFYFLLTGHPPFPEGTLPQRLMMHQTKAPASIYKDRPDAPKELVDLCTRMMAKSPGARVQSAREVSEQLAVWLAQRGRVVGGGSGASGVLTAAADEARRLAAAAGASGTAAPPGRREGGPPHKRPGHQPASDDTLSIADEETTGPVEKPRRSRTGDSSSIQLVPAAPEPKIGTPSSTAAKPDVADASSPASAALLKEQEEENQDLITQLDDALDLDSLVPAGELDKSWPSTSAIAERKRRDRERVSPWVWIAAFGGGSFLLLVMIILVVLLIRG